MKIVIAIVILLCLATQVKSQENVYMSKDNELVFKLDEDKYAYDELQDYVVTTEWENLLNRALNWGIKNQTLKVDVERWIGEKPITLQNNTTTGLMMEIFFTGHSTGKWEVRAEVQGLLKTVYGFTKLSKQDLIIIVTDLKSRSRELKVIFDKQAQFK